MSGRSRIKLTDAEKDELIERYASGEIGSVLSAEYGVSKAYISQLASSRGIHVGYRSPTVRRWNERLSAEQRAEIVRRNRAGERNCDLAQEFGVSRTFVSNLIAQHVARSCGDMTAGGSFIEHWTPSHKPVPAPNAIAGIPLSRLMAGR